MQATFLALGSTGDILPYATLGARLLAAGHQVCFVTTQDFEPLLSGFGLDVLPVPGDAQTVIRRAGANVSKLMLAFARLSRSLTTVLDPSTPPLDRSDIIINQLPIGVYGYDLAEKLGIPMVLAAVIPLTRTSAFPMMGFDTPFSAAGGFNRLTYYLYEQMSWHTLRRGINRWRQTRLGLPKIPLGGHMGRMVRSKVPILNGFSSHLFPRPPDWGDHVHITGYWYPADENWLPPSSLLRFLAAGPPPVFLGFGSMPLRDPGRTTDLILEALALSGQRSVLQAGWGGLGDRTLPDSVHLIQYVPYGWLFPQMAAIVHHGGSGTTAFSLRSGVPSLVVPFLFDQHFWGNQTAKVGVGPKPIPFRRMTAQKLAAAIELMTGDVKMRRQAETLGRAIRSEDGLGNAVAVIEGQV